jgi:chromosome segregation ATPase
MGQQKRQQEAAQAQAARAAAEAIAKARVQAGASPIPVEPAVASSSGPDAEARQLKLRGDIVKHTEAVASARARLEQLDVALRQATTELRRTEDQYETAHAAQARGRAGARRQHTEQRLEVGALRRELDDLDAQVEQARTELGEHPSRRALISDRAWDRAVERHVEPDDAALRARIRAGETGRNGAYGSHADLALAAADIHTHLSQQPGFQAVLAARTRADFERAAAALPGGVTDLVHDHGRQVGRGFSSDPDQTERPTPLTQSSFSLQFVQGRVVVSHLFPHVPHRQLTTSV